MMMDEDDFKVGPNMFLRVPGDAFHRVVNEDGGSDLVFLCVWHENNDNCAIIENTIIEQILTADFSWATT